jgi:hypothetical protein
LVLMGLPVVQGAQARRDRLIIREREAGMETGKARTAETV